MRIKEYPDYSHDMSYQPALIDGLKGYAGYCLACNHGPASKTLYPVHIELSGENLNGEVYLTGNPGDSCKLESRRRKNDPDE